MPINPADLTKYGAIAAAQDAVTMTSIGMGQAAVQVAGTFVATLQFEVTASPPSSAETPVWVAASATPAAGGSAVSSATAPGAWTVPLAGWAQLRVRCSAYTSGTPAVRMTGGEAGGSAAAAGGSSALAAGENHVGEVGGNSVLFDLTLSLDTLIYADGDVLADTQVCTGFFRVTNGTAVLQSVTVIDEDDQGQAFDLIFFSANRALGTENAAPSISDANARDCLGRVQVLETDYYDLGGVRVATVPASRCGLVLKAVSATADLYVGAVSRGTGTYTASGVKLRIAALRD